MRAATFLAASCQSLARITCMRRAVEDLLVTVPKAIGGDNLWLVVALEHRGVSCVGLSNHRDDLEPLFFVLLLKSRRCYLGAQLNSGQGGEDLLRLLVTSTSMPPGGGRETSRSMANAIWLQLPSPYRCLLGYAADRPNLSHRN